jgi:hypothetical protein
LILERRNLGHEDSVAFGKEVLEEGLKGHGAGEGEGWTVD